MVLDGAADAEYLAGNGIGGAGVRLSCCAPRSGDCGRDAEDGAVRLLVRRTLRANG